MKAKAPNIFTYTSYTLYLRDYYAFKKKENKKFTYRLFGAMAQTAPSLLKDIIDGRRSLSLDTMRKFAKAMGINKREKEFFKILIKFSNSKTNLQKNKYFHQIIHSRRNLSIEFLEESQYQFYSEWYHSAIRELINFPSFIEDPEWISKKLTPNITPGKVKKSLALMERLNIIKRNEKQKLIQSQNVISSELEIQSMIIRNFNTGMIKLALEAQESFPLETREISGLTLGVSQKKFAFIKQRIREFKEELLASVQEDQDSTELVCQVNFQLFPLVVGVSNK